MSLRYSDYAFVFRRSIAGRTTERESEVLLWPSPFTFYNIQREKKAHTSTALETRHAEGATGFCTIAVVNYYTALVAEEERHAQIQAPSVYLYSVGLRRPPAWWWPSFLAVCTALTLLKKIDDFVKHERLWSDHRAMTPAFVSYGRWPATGRALGNRPRVGRRPADIRTELLDTNLTQRLADVSDVQLDIGGTSADL